MSLRKLLSKEFENRLKSLKFESGVKLKEWKGFKVVDLVYDKEMVLKFKSTEERLLCRVELWIDLNRVETGNDGVTQQSAGKFYTAKRYKKIESKKSKSRSFSMGRISSKSVNNIQELFNEERAIVNDSPSMSPSYSTNDILSDVIAVENGNSASPYGTMPKRKKRFFFFKRKELCDFYDDGAKRRHSSKKEKKSKNNVQIISSSFSDRSGFKRVNMRPSLFTMESAPPNISKLSIYSEVTSPENRNTATGRFNAATTKQETLFNSAVVKDSFRFQNDSGSSQNSKHKQLFYYPNKQAEMGEI